MPPRKLNLPPDWAQQLKEEQRRERALAREWREAVRQGDLDAFKIATGRLYNEGGWPIALRMLVRDPQPRIRPAIRHAFRQAWTEEKSLRLKVGNDRLTCTVLRMFWPQYRGPARRLYRGTSAEEARRRRYGISWTTDVEIAEGFARKEADTLVRLQRANVTSVKLGGGVVLETLVPPSAIIGPNKYPRPFTDEERRGFPATATVVEFHEEREYLVDGPALEKVEIIRRYP